MEDGAALSEIWSSQVSEQSVFGLALVKRETGANPVRTRHRNKGAKADGSLGNWEEGVCEDL